MGPAHLGDGAAAPTPTDRAFADGVDLGVVEVRLGPAVLDQAIAAVDLDPAAIEMRPAVEDLGRLDEALADLAEQDAEMRWWRRHGDR